MISIAQRRIGQVEATLCREFSSVRDRSALAGALAAEHMRALIYGAAVQQDPSAARTVHTTRLLTSARRAVELVWPQYANRPRSADICSVTLDQVQAIGDALDIGGGQWLAAPLRVIAPEAGSRCLLVGAAPAQAAYRRIGVAPLCAGTSRFVDAAALQAKGRDDLVLSPDTWLGEQPALSAWTVQLLAAHEARMESVEGLAAEHLEIYAPDVSQAQRRTGRWVCAGQIGRPLEGPRLCRPQDRYAKSWDRPLYLAHFDYANGALKLRRAESVNRDLTLRLRFGLDVILKMPRRLSIVEQGEFFSIERPLTLPQPEHRVYALGWKDHAENEDSDRITFHADAMPFVIAALHRLAVATNVTREGAA